MTYRNGPSKEELMNMLAIANKEKEASVLRLQDLETQLQNRKNNGVLSTPMVNPKNSTHESIMETWDDLVRKESVPKPSLDVAIIFLAWTYVLLFWFGLSTLFITFLLLV